MVAKQLLKALKKCANDAETQPETQLVAAIIRSTIAHFERFPEYQDPQDILIALVLNALEENKKS